MSAFFSPRIQRATAWAMLLVWLFALSAGVANACLIEEQRPHGHAAATDATSHHSSGVTAGHRIAPSTVGDHDARLASKAPCLKVCDETTQAPVNQAATPDLDAPALVTAPWSPWSTPPSLEGVDVRGANVARLPPADPPARVKYSRLVL